ncbi:hydroxymethylpyrimidine/phosphomethylpyrimidine kinase [Actinomycetota bacterium]|nr:hydroxymethylpyrimidine/phosphomethylpyrimidine kinase [Actinomycetota bacterium]
MGKIAHLNKKVVLTIAGFDSRSGGGMVTDALMFSKVGVFPLCVHTATVVVDDKTFKISPCSAQLVAAQFEALAEVNFAAIKIGFIPNNEILDLVVDFVAQRPNIPLIVDPVLSFKEGEEGWVEDVDFVPKLIKLMKNANYITPNRTEWEYLQKFTDVLRGSTIVVKDIDPTSQNAHDLVLIYGQKKPLSLVKPRVKTSTNNGAGCALSAAICALAALYPRFEPHEVVSKAKNLVWNAISVGFQFKKGGSVHPV